MIGQHRGKGIHPHAVRIDRNPGEGDTPGAQTGNGPAIAEFLEQDRVARGAQHGVDEFQGLVRSRGDQHRVGGDRHAAPFGQLAHDEVAQRPVAERAALQAIGGKGMAFAAQHVRNRLDHVVNRNAGAVVVPADEIVAGKTRPARGRYRQLGTEQVTEFDVNGHRRHPPLQTGPSHYIPRMTEPGHCPPPRNRTA